MAEKEDQREDSAEKALEDADQSETEQSASEEDSPDEQEDGTDAQILGNQVSNHVKAVPSPSKGLELMNFCIL